jgi:hypothetical protein
MRSRSVKVEGNTIGKPAHSRNTQETATGNINGDEVQMDATETTEPGRVPFTSNHWVVSITPAGSLHLTHYRHSLSPGGTS